ncbi:MAG: hypothetical protein KGI87_06100 [Burkholderiales bacterium]|nr:hypothetical protein [Burkholderiales bacterium]
MELEQLMGRYHRLKQELAAAYKTQPWHAARIDRLADDLAAAEREITALQPHEARRSAPPATLTR